MTKVQALIGRGQSIWLDFIQRGFTDSGGLQDLIDQGVRGVTSDPTIFDKAIEGSADYDADLERHARAGAAAEAIYEALVSADIRAAADGLRAVYDTSDGLDGYVSLEVSPTLAYDTEGTVAEARRLFGALNRPNVMIKIPATPPGIPAVAAAIAAGVNVNVTLIFGLGQYEAVAGAYLDGLERWREAGGDPARIASVASFFVSRVDTAVDEALKGTGDADLTGRIAIDNARMAYARFRTLFSGERWERLAASGARVQRPLWASTGTKNPRLPDTLYVDELVGADTVNTLPPATLEAFLDHGRTEPSIERDLEASRERIERLASSGIVLDAVTERLLDEGVDSFARSFKALLAGIEEKCRDYAKGRSVA